MGSSISVHESVPPERIAELIRQYVVDFQELPLVSVGSGTGVIEFRVKQLLECKIICVDPVPESYLKYSKSRDNCLEPDFPLVTDLIESMPNIISNCHVLIYWPYFGNTTYDIQSISLLKPKYVILVYELLGGAGGEMMHSWLDSMGIESGIQRSNIEFTMPAYRNVFFNLEYSSQPEEDNIGYRSMAYQHVAVVILERID